MKNVNIYNAKKIVSFSLLVFFTAFCFYRTLMIANDIFNNTGQYDFSYKWLFPQFAFIQGPNSVLKKFHIVIILCSILSFEHNTTFLKNYKKSMKSCVYYAAIVSLISLILSVAEFGFLFVDAQFNLLFRSMVSFFCFYIYCLFWSFFTLGLLYGIKILFLNPLATCFFGIVLLTYESTSLYFNFSLFGQFSPYILAKEIVVNSFPYWSAGGWVVQANIGFPYANVSAFYHKPLNVFIIILILFLYLLFF